MYSSTDDITANINELQADILAEKISTNPFLKYHVLVEKNKKLGTTSQSIIGAINEVLRKANSAANANSAALNELYSVIGHIGTFPELSRKVLAQAPSLIELVLNMKDRIDSVDVASFADFTESFSVGKIPKYLFVLSHEPVEGTLRMLVNGVRYDNTSKFVAFACNPKDRTVNWNFDKSNGGFNLSDCEVTFEYKYSLKNVTSQ